MDTLKKLQTVIDYYVRSRGKGHTSLLQVGADNIHSPYWLVVQVRSNRGLFEHRKQDKCVIVEDLGAGCDPRPIIWDNSAIMDLCKEAVTAIEFLMRENADLAKKIQKVKDAVK